MCVGLVLSVRMFRSSCSDALMAEEYNLPSASWTRNQSSSFRYVCGLCNPTCHPLYGALNIVVASVFPFSLRALLVCVHLVPLKFEWLQVAWHVALCVPISVSVSSATHLHVRASVCLVPSTIELIDV